MEIPGAHQFEDFRHYTAGELIFSEGDPGEEMYVVLEGEVVITVQGEQFNRLKSGAVFGEMALVDDRPRSASATAVTACRLAALDRGRFMALVKESPEFAMNVMSTMSRRLRRLMEDELQRLRMEEELKIGHRIQLSLLPERCPVVPGWEFAAEYRSARQVGGDFYDFIFSPEDEDLVSIVIADVTGKGVPAALFMASSRTAIRAETLTNPTPAETLAQTNRLISLDRQSPLFLSAFYATLEISSGRLCYANGGHDWPLWLDGNGTVTNLRAQGMVLGAFADAKYQQQEIVVAKGDSLIFFTDGVTEARNSEGHFFGEERLMKTVMSRSWQNAQELLRHIVEAVDNFRGPTPLSDDLTAVVVRRKPAPEV